MAIRQGRMRDRGENDPRESANERGRFRGRLSRPETGVAPLLPPLSRF